MKSSFVIAAFIGAVSAEPQPLNKVSNNPAFVNYLSKQNKHYTTTNELNQRAQIYSSNDDEIAKLNAHSKASGRPNAAHFEHNMFSDMTSEEFSHYLGLKEKDPRMRISNMGRATGDEGRGSRDRGEALGRQATRGSGSGGRGRGLVADATTVDHVKAGHMGPVKQQGNCGSCWAFAANTALEGYIAKKNGTSPVRLSEQQLVDCTLTNNSFNRNLFGKDYGLWGCGGGWMSLAWKFQKEQGVMTDAQYPYTSGNTGRETQCAHSATNQIGKVTRYGQITTNIDDVKAKLATHPLTIAVDAGRSAFQFYRSGVVSASDGCGTSLNHAVVVVGYTDTGDSTPVDPTPDPSPSPSPTPDPTPTPDPVTTCDVTKWWHSCSGGNTRRLQDANGNQNYWKIQNSWGRGWGDNGFILFEITSGQGVCGMNSYIEWAEM